MKFKKTLALIMTAAMTIGTMAGCSQATQNLSSEISKTSQWEAYNMDSEGKQNIEMLGSNQEIKFTSTGYSTKDKAYIDMKFDNGNSMYKLPELKEYFDGKTLYINKNYYEETYSLNGLAVPEGLSKIKEEYIGIDLQAMGIDMNKLSLVAGKPDSMAVLSQLVLGSNNVLDLPFVQNGRDYTLNLNSSQIVDLATKVVNTGVSNLENAANLENLNNTLGLQIKSEDVKGFKAAYDGAGYDTKLEGSTANLKYTFTDNSCTVNYNINLQIKDFGKYGIDMKTTSTKSELKDLTFPTSTIKFTPEELTKLITPTAQTNTEIEASTNVVAK